MGLTVMGAALLGLVATTQAQAPAKKPNILVIFGDDIGQSNISAYTHGLMGYPTPNIDRIAKDGMMFTDYYAENSCTAGRSTFITGQSVLRTGLSKVGVPGAPVGLQKGDITIAEALKPLGYATGQFGKNHLGDKNEYLPTAHGFDEFFGNLYHLNAEEEPERPYWPKDRNDPYERADITSNTYYDWMLQHAFLAVPTQQFVARFLETFKEYPPRQKAASFSIDQVIERLQQQGAGK